MNSDLIDGHGGVVPERAAIDHSAHDLARLVVEQAIEDLAGWDEAQRADVKTWMTDLEPEACGVEWCADTLGVSVEALIGWVFRAAHGRRLRRYIHRREIEAAHNPNQMTIAECA